jgi:hypothetical protein
VLALFPDSDNRLPGVGDRESELRGDCFPVAWPTLTSRDRFSIDLNECRRVSPQDLALARDGDGLEQEYACRSATTAVAGGNSRNVVGFATQADSTWIAGR